MAKIKRKKRRKSDKYWIQGSIKRPGRSRAYVKRLYGSKAFDKKGRIKPEYLERAIKKAKEAGNTSLVRALNEAKTLKKLRRKRRK